MSDETRIYNLADLQGCMGDMATTEDASAMRDGLIAAGLLRWVSDRDGGWMDADIPEDVWLDMMRRAVEG